MPTYEDRLQFNTDYLPKAPLNTSYMPNYGFKTDDGNKVDWAKFAMWLRGFLAAVEGQPLTPESVSKIMEKLATVDPDKNLSYHSQWPEFRPAEIFPSKDLSTVNWDQINWQPILCDDNTIHILNNANIQSSTISTTKSGK